MWNRTDWEWYSKQDFENTVNTQYSKYQSIFFLLFGLFPFANPIKEVYS